MDPFQILYQAHHIRSTPRTEIKPRRTSLDKNWFLKILSYKCMVKGKGVTDRSITWHLVEQGNRPSLSIPVSALHLTPPSQLVPHPYAHPYAQAGTPAKALPLPISHPTLTSPHHLNQCLTHMRPHVPRPSKIVCSFSQSRVSSSKLSGNCFSHVRTVS